MLIKERLKVAPFFDLCPVSNRSFADERVGSERRNSKFLKEWVPNEKVEFRFKPKSFTPNCR